MLNSDQIAFGALIVALASLYISFRTWWNDRPKIKTKSWISGNGGETYLNFSIINRGRRSVTIHSLTIKRDDGRTIRSEEFVVLGEGGRHQDYRSADQLIQTEQEGDFACVEAWWEDTTEKRYPIKDFRRNGAKIRMGKAS